MTKEKIKKKRGRPSNAELKRRKDEAEKTLIIRVVAVIGIILMLGIFVQSVTADELVHKFSNPSFSGINQSAHYLTIDEQERTRKEKIAEKIQEELEDAEREAENTVLAKFIRNLESRIYSTLAKDISESLFNYEGNPTIDNPISGEINLEGNILRWVNNGITITLTIEEWFDGVLICTTEIVIPIGSFGGCWTDCDSG